jgi:hypothetical protein
MEGTVTFGALLSFKAEVGAAVGLRRLVTRLLGWGSRRLCLYVQ